MAGPYDVVSIFTVVDDATAKLEDIADYATRAADAVDALTDALSALSAKGSTSLDSLTTQMEALDSSATSMATTFSTAFASINASFASAIANAQTLSGLMDDISTQAAVTGVMGSGRGSGRGSGSGGRGGGGGPRTPRYPSNFDPDSPYNTDYTGPGALIPSFGGQGGPMVPYGYGFPNHMDSYPSGPEPEYVGPGAMIPSFGGQGGPLVPSQGGALAYPFPTAPDDSWHGDPNYPPGWNDWRTGKVHDVSSGGGGNFFDGSLFSGSGSFAAGAALGKFTKILPPELLELFAVYEAFKGSASEDLSLREMLIQEQIDPDSAQGQQDISVLRNIVQNQAYGTIYSANQTAAAYASASGLLGYTGQAGQEQAEQILPVAVRAGEVAEQQGLGDLITSANAAIAYAHMTGRFTPEALSPGLDQLLNLSEKLHISFAAEESILKYGIPEARQLGIDPDTAADYIGFLQRMGLTGTTAGTTFGQMLTGLLRTGGPINSHLEQARDFIEQDIGLNPDAFGAKGTKQLSQHLQALHDFGFLDDKNQLTVFDKDGNLDFPQVVEDLQKFAATHSKAQFGTDIYDAFGIRGLKGADIFGDVGDPAQLASWLALIKGADATEGVVAQQQQLANAPMQKFEQTIARTGDLLNSAVTSSLPPLTAALTVVNGTLQGVITALDVFNSIFASAPRNPNQPGRYTNPSALKAEQDKDNQSWSAWWHHQFDASAYPNRFHPAPAPPVPPALRLPASQTIDPALLHKTAYEPTVSVTIHGMNFYGTSQTPQEQARQIADEIAKEIAKVQVNNLGRGQGTYSSVYTSGI